jgi:hypothetical protein
MKIILIFILSLVAAFLNGCDSKSGTTRQVVPQKLVVKDENAMRLSQQREQMRVDCIDKQSVQDAEYKRLFEVGKYWEARSAIRECAESLADEKRNALVAAAEVKHYLERISKVNVSSRDKATAVEHLIRDYPEYGKKYDRLFAQLSRKAEAEENTADLKLKKSKGINIGMNREDVLASSWGKPDSVNRTTTSNTTSEQWIYGGRNYLYFENGKLSTIQN